MYDQFLPLILFGIATAFTPGPNNILSSYSGFNFGFKKTIPLMLGVILGWTTMLTVMASGLIIIFQKYIFLQSIIKILGTIFLIYLAYKIAFSSTNESENIKKPVLFFDTFLFQFINPKGVMVAMIAVSTFIDVQNNYLRDATIVIITYFFMAVFSVSSWCLLGKYLRKFATSKNFIKKFNYIMSFLLIVCVIMFYV
jgi:threonine/homoserine/homoserine lactone efflux protein